jgi:UDP-2,3-diacylglucosamine pyrophosphatase LpxH
MWSNKLTDQVRDLLGLPYWSLARWVKKNVSKAEEAINAYQLAAINMVKDKGYDGIVCGHLHFPTLRTDDGVMYFNDGDWVENCTALIELEDGSIRLIKGVSHPESIKQMIFIDATDEFTR